MPLARCWRSGVVESVHVGHVAVVDAEGDTVAGWGDTEASFFMRSAAKPFQAAVSQANGADLSTRQLAVATASHSGEPVHTSIVSGMLQQVGLGPEHLLCPADWPMHTGAARRESMPSAIANNCSGKHAAMLRACVASGWPLDYTDPEHPLADRNAAFIAEVTGVDPHPAGIDGCGVPTFRTTVRGLATAFARLATGMPEVFGAMHRYPFLTAGSGRPEPSIAVATNAAVKGGAKGCLGVAVWGQYGIAVKATDGSLEPAAVAAIEVLRRLGLVTPAAGSALRRHSHPPVRGGGAEVGRCEPALP